MGGHENVLAELSEQNMNRRVRKYVVLQKSRHKPVDKETSGVKLKTTPKLNLLLSIEKKKR